MNLLFLDHTTELGGAQVSLLGLLETLDRSRHTTTLACPPGRLAERAGALGAAIVEARMPKVREGRNPLTVARRLAAGRAEVRALASSGRWDLLHANTLRTALYASLVPASGRPPFVWHVRDAAIPHLARRWLLSRCDVAIAPSNYIAALLGCGAKVRIVPNGLDPRSVPERGAGLAFRREFGIGPDAPVVGCLGRLLRWKGQHFFLDVAARLAHRVPEAVFLVVGSNLYSDPRDDYARELRRLAQGLGIEDRVLFTGQREDPLAAASAMDVVVNCSRDEPFGRVLIEAMACGRPVVAFRSGAVPEIVHEGVSGLLVRFGDTAGMAEAVLGLLRDRERGAAYGQAGRTLVAARFSLQAATRGVEAVYAELAGVPRPEKGGRGPDGRD